MAHHVLKASRASPNLASRLTHALDKGGARNTYATNMMLWIKRTPDEVADVLQQAKTSRRPLQTNKWDPFLRRNQKFPDRTRQWGQWGIQYCNREISSVSGTNNDKLEHSRSQALQCEALRVPGPQCHPKQPIEFVRICLCGSRLHTSHFARVKRVRTRNHFVLSDGPAKSHSLSSLVAQHPKTSLCISHGAANATQVTGLEDQTQTFAKVCQTPGQPSSKRMYLNLRGWLCLSCTHLEKRYKKHDA